MSFDLDSILTSLPRRTAGEAARSLNHLLEALHDSLPVGHDRELFLALVSERLYALRCGMARGPTWVQFSHLVVGECFVDAQGRSMRKIEPQKQQNPDGSFAPPFVAVELQTGTPMFVRANARVERTDSPSDLT